MMTCTSCGNDVTGKKFCATCGTRVQPVEVPSASGQYCPACRGEIKPGAAFCMHCGASLREQATPAPPPPPTVRPCPACQAVVGYESVFCTSCGHDMRAATAVSHCHICGHQNVPGVKFCGSCGNPLSPSVPATNPSSYAPSGPYTNYPQQPQYPPTYSQQQYPQQTYNQQQYQPYQQQQYTPGYQPAPMMGQQPTVLRCPTCMAIAPLGTTVCAGCRTNLVGVVPTPAQMPMQGGQQGGFLQGDAGKYAVGALGGAAAIIGGQMLLHNIEDGLDFNGGHHHREGGGGLFELADDIGLI